MEFKFEKQMDLLEKEVILKSVDLDDDIEDYEVDIDEFQSNETFMAISPRCVRCNLCVEQCPVGAISGSTYSKRARILNNCVKCEVCVETCPVSAIYIFEAEAKIEKGEDEIKPLSYSFSEKKIPHRILRLNDITMDRSKCIGCGHCTAYCPTKANKLVSKEFIEKMENQEYENYESGQLYPFINKDLCVGCGSCSNICAQDVYTLDRYLGPVINTKKLIIDDETCVACFLCEDNCPTGAIQLNNDNVPEIVPDKCIRCNTCSTVCPVGALKLEDIDLN